MTDWPEQYRVAAKEWVDKNAAADLLEQTKTATFAEKTQPLIESGMAVNKAETQIKASDDWHTYLEEMVAARKAADFARVKLEYIRMKFKQQEGKNYAVRAEMNMHK